MRERVFLKVEEDYARVMPPLLKQKDIFTFCDATKTDEFLSFATILEKGIKGELVNYIIVKEKDIEEVIKTRRCNAFFLLDFKLSKNREKTNAIFSNKDINYFLLIDISQEDWESELIEAVAAGVKVLFHGETSDGAAKTLLHYLCYIDKMFPQLMMVEEMLRKKETTQYTHGEEMPKCTKCNLYNMCKGFSICILEIYIIKDCKLLQTFVNAVMLKEILKGENKDVMSNSKTNPSV